MDPRLFRRIAAGCVVLLSIAGAAVGPVSALPSKNETWIRVDTENFTLFSNAGQRRSASVGRNLERLRSVLIRSSKGMKFNSPLPTQIYVFKNDASFAPYKIDHDGKPSNLVGYFVASSEGNYVAVDVSAGANSFMVVYHEYIHYYLGNNVPDVPLWVQEGLAEFYSTFDVRAGRAEIGRPVENHLLYLSQSKLIPLNELFEIDTSSSDYNEGRRQGTFYAQSWALVHYLLTDEQRRDRFGDYVTSIARGTDPTEAFQRAFALDYATLEKEIEKYVRRHSFGYYWYDLEGGLETAEPRVQTLERSEALYRLADLLAHHPPVQYGDAERHLRAALELDESNAGAYRTFGVLEAHRGRYAEAAGYFEQAVRADPADAVSHSRYGASLLEQFFSAEQSGVPTAASETPPMLLEARRQFRKSLERDPDNLEALTGLGTTFLFDEFDLDEGIEALRKAADVQPSRTDILYHLIVLTARSGQEAEARAILDRALRPRSRDPGIVRAAENAVLGAVMEQAIDLYNSGKREEAREMIQRAADEARDPELRAKALAQLGAMSSTTKSAADVELFNRAIRAANEQDLEQAVELLERFLATSENAEMKELARTQLESIKTVTHRNRLVQLHNEAIVHARAGRYEEAAELLEQVLRSDPPDDLGKVCEAALKQINQARKGRR